MQNVRHRQAGPIVMVGLIWKRADDRGRRADRGVRAPSVSYAVFRFRLASHSAATTPSGPTGLVPGR